MVEGQEEVPDLHQPTRTGQTVTIPDGYLTREDVRLLRFMAQVYLRDEGAEGEGWRSSDAEAAQDVVLPSLAARIEALLPPEAK